MNAWMWLRGVHKLCHFQTKEGRRVGEASNSELKRWLQQGVVIVSGKKIAWDEEVVFPIISVVLWPNNPRKKTTLM